MEELFSGRHFDWEVIILCVSWYLRYKLSFRDLVERMSERGLRLAHTTILRCAQRYASEFIKRWNRFSQPADRSWRVDETYNVYQGPRQRTYLYRAADKCGQTIHFFRLRKTRDVSAAKAFFKKAIRHQGQPPITITLDSYAASHRAVRETRTDSLLPPQTKLRSSKYLNNLIGQDHRGVKSRTEPMLGFKNFESAAVSITGVELLPLYSGKSIRPKQTEDQRQSCARDLECRARRVKDNITLSPTLGYSGYLHQISLANSCWPKRWAASREPPRVQIEATVVCNAQLLELVSGGRLDLALAWDAGNRTPHCRVVADLPMRWIGRADSAVGANDEPQPLGALDTPCLMCSAANKALDKAGVPWCVAFTCSSLSGIWTAVNAGLGITVRTSVELPKQLRKLNGLPILPKIGLGLHRTDSRLERHVERLETILLEGPDNVWSAG